MNRVFRKVWNCALGAFVVASELAKSDGKKGAGLAAKPAVVALVVGLFTTGNVLAQQAGTGEPSSDGADEIAEVLERHLQEQEDAVNASQLPAGIESLLFASPDLSAPIGIMPMGVIDPGGLTGGTLPGLVQHLNNFLLVGGPYRSCGLLGGGEILPHECMTIARENFNYAFQAVSLLGVDLLTIPHVADLNGNRPADHITIIGRATSGSYITVPNMNYAGQFNNPDCELVLGVGVCIDGVLGTYTWDTRPAQNYQIIIGDGAAANGSNTVVLGTNASHTLPTTTAAALGWTGGPNGDYASRLGNAVVIGHGATGTADRQTILGVNARSTHANSVALGAESVTARGTQASYIAPGMAALQSSVGEVSVGSSGALRQITHIAAGSAATDAVNVAQMLGAISEVNADSAFAVKYDDDGTGSPDYDSITLQGAGGTVISNLAAGEVSATSDEAINGAQLFGVSQSVTNHLGGGSTVNINGTINAPTYIIQGDTYNTVGDAFDAVDDVLGNIGNQVDAVDAFAVKYDDDGTGNPDYGRATLAGVGGTTLANVAAGVADDEAVNVGQLSPVVDALGGGAGIDPGTGAVIGPTYVLDDGSDTGTTVTYTDVGSALENLDGRVSTNTTNINNLYETGSKYFQVNSTWGASQALGNNSVAIGPGTVANGIAGFAAGFDAISTGTGALVIGYQASARQDAATAIGRQSQAHAAGSTALGYWAQTFGVASVAIGQQSLANADTSIAIGLWAQSFGNNSVALGPESVANSEGGVALGFGARANRAGMNGATELFSGTAVQSSLGAISVGSTYDPDDSTITGERQITHVAGGTADTDAVNVRQLRAVADMANDADAFAVKYDDDGTGNPDHGRATLAGVGGTTLANVAAGVADDEAVNVGQLSPVVDALGGGAGIDPGTGAVTGPTYVLDDGSDTGTTVNYTDVGSALENLDGRVVTNTTNINNLLMGTVGLVRQDPVTLRVTVAGHTGGTEVSFANVDGDARRLSGVADGVDDTDAANMGQLRAVEDQIGDLDALAVKYDDNTFAGITLQGTGGTVISNLAAGEVSATSDEAINGAQLFGVSQSVANHLGGGSTVNINGTINAPTYIIQGDTYNNVGDAFDAVDDVLGNIGNQVDAVDAFAVKYDDDGTGNPDYGRATLAGVGGTTLANVAAGVADDEAVNVGQLSPVVDALGGGAGIDPGTGAVTGPTYVLDDGSDTGTTVNYTDVGSALENLDGRVVTNTTNINNLLMGTEGLVRQDPGTLRVTVAGHTGGTEVSFANVAGAARRLSGVADGVDDTDAANMGQLRAVENQIGDLDALAVKYDDNTFAGITLQGASGTVIDNLAAGMVSATSLQAINGSQLHGYLGRVMAYFGGGVRIDPLGAVFGPSYMIQGNFYDNVGDALAALDRSLDDVNERIDGLPGPGGGSGDRDSLVAVDGVRDGTDDAIVVDEQRGVAIGSNASSDGLYGVAIGGGSHAAGDQAIVIGGSARALADNGTAIGANTAISAGATNAVAVGEGATVTAASGTAIGQGSSVTAQNAVALGRGSVADQANTVSVGSAGNQRRVTNVAAGTATTDAVNVGQLNAGVQHAINTSNEYTNMRLSQVQSDLWDVDRGYRAGVASAMAVAGLPQAYMPGKSMMAAAVSGYKSEGALAVGITTISESGRWVYKFSGTTNSTRDVGITVGAGIQW